MLFIFLDIFFCFFWRRSVFCFFWECFVYIFVSVVYIFEHFLTEKSTLLLWRKFRKGQIYVFGKGRKIDLLFLLICFLLSVETCEKGFLVFLAFLLKRIVIKSLLIFVLDICVWFFFCFIFQEKWKTLFFNCLLYFKSIFVVFFQNVFVLFFVLFEIYFGHIRTYNVKIRKTVFCMTSRFCIFLFADFFWIDILLLDCLGK